MPFEYGIFYLVVYQFGRTVVITFNLIAYHFHLFIYLVLRIDAVENDIGKQVYGAWNVFFQYCSVVNGVFFIGKSIDIAANTLERVQYVPRPSVACTLERHVFAEVRQALLFLLFVPCTGIDPVTAVHYRRCRGQMNNAQSAGKRMGIVIHNDCKDTKNKYFSG